MAIDRATASILGLNDITGGDAGGEDVAVPEDDLTFADGASITPDEDGGETIDFAPEDDEEGPVAHDDNLAEYMEDSDLQSLANDILDYVDEDRKSRSDWESMLSQGLTYLGLKIEDRSIPFSGAAGVFDPILLCRR